MSGIAQVYACFMNFNHVWLYNVSIHCFQFNENSMHEGMKYEFHVYMLFDLYMLVQCVFPLNMSRFT